MPHSRYDSRVATSGPVSLNRPSTPATGCPISVRYRNSTFWSIARTTRATRPVEVVGLQRQRLHLGHEGVDLGRGQRAPQRAPSEAGDEAAQAGLVAGAGGRAADQPLPHAGVGQHPARRRCRPGCGRPRSAPPTAAGGRTCCRRRTRRRPRRSPRGTWPARSPRSRPVRSRMVWRSSPLVSRRMALAKNTRSSPGGGGGTGVTLLPPGGLTEPPGGVGSGRDCRGSRPRGRSPAPLHPAAPNRAEQTMEAAARAVHPPRCARMESSLLPGERRRTSAPTPHTAAAVSVRRKSRPPGPFPTPPDPLHNRHGPEHPYWDSLGYPGESTRSGQFWRCLPQDRRPPFTAAHPTHPEPRSAADRGM